MVAERNCFQLLVVIAQLIVTKQDNNHLKNYLDPLYRPQPGLSLQIPRACDENFEFRCLSGQCISRAHHCDGLHHCLDHSDEDYCGHPCEHASMFHCHNDNCIHGVFVCDGENDCGDWSDENFCSDFARKIKDNKPIQCEPDHFFCDITCVPNDWRCDGSVDCPSGADETGCNETATSVPNDCVGPDKFVCGNQCLPLEWVCDGSTDCHDGSDEANCDLRDRYGGCALEHGFFECQDRKCLPANKLCNNVSDCSRNEDEGAGCAVPCNLSCGHKCINTPTGPHCVCPQGFKLSSDQNKCDDIDECHLDWSVCSQRCSNGAGSFTCSCYDGFSLRPDNQTCNVVGHPETVYLATNHDVRSLTYQTPGLNKNVLDSSHWMLKEVMTSLSDPRSLAADIDGHVFFLIDGTSVYKATQHGSHRRRILSNDTTITAAIRYHGNGENDFRPWYQVPWYLQKRKQRISAPESVAVDWVAKNFYVSDSSSKQIVACSIVEIQCTIVLQGSPIDRPQALAVDSVERLIFWTDFVKGRSGSAYIGRANLDGSERRKLPVEGLQLPNTLAVDTEEKRLYFGDLETKRIESVSYEGDRRKVIVANLHEPVSVDVFGDWLYWIDRELQELQHCLKANGKQKSAVYKHMDNHMNTVLVTHQLKQRKTQNDCADAGCSHICLLSPKKTFFTCACPNSFILSQDGKTCKVSGDIELVVVSSGGKLTIVSPHVIGDGIVSSHQLPKGTDKITALAYDPASNYVIFAEGETEAIYRYFVQSERVERLMETWSEAVEGIAIDPSTSNIYWVDGDHRQVVLANPTTKFKKVLITGLLNPSGIAISLEHRLLFVADAGGVRSLPKIIQYSLDGKNAKDFISDLPSPAESLVYDHTRKALYWTYGIATLSFGGSIEKATVPTGTVSTYRKNLSRPESISISSGFVYWVSSMSPSLEWAEKDSMKGIKRLHYGHENSNKFANLHRIAVMQPLPSDQLHMNTTCSAATCAHFCIPLDGKHVCECATGFESVAGGATCMKADCKESEFQCQSGECRTKSESCDGIRDCPDGSDEIGCANTCDLTNQYQCSNKQCISKKFVCDGEKDCPSAEDEANCQFKPVNCTVHEYACKSGYQCIQFELLCDGHNDCIDHTDETTCMKECPFRHTHCSGNTTICVPDEFICDDYEDCPGGSDEENCPPKRASPTITTPHPLELTCPPASRLCNDTQSCVSEGNVCDGEEDCDDGSDEVGCDDHSEHRHGDLSCPKGTFSCYRGFVECVPVSALCNCSAECFHGEDELHCPPTSCKPELPAGTGSGGDHYFSCGGQDSSYSIPLSWVCDGEPDCNNGADETSPACNKTKPEEFGCPGGLHQCKNGQCILPENVCDNTAHCDDGSDEGKGCERTCDAASASYWRLRKCDSCHNTPSGPQCRCAAGYKLNRDGTSCEDINECLISAVRTTLTSALMVHSVDEHPDFHDHHDDDIVFKECSHICENTKGGYRCKCGEGYKLAGDRHTCRATTRPDIMFTTLHNIRSLKADRNIPQVVPVIAHSDEGIVDVDFDIEERAIFWITHSGYIYVTNETAMTNHHEFHDAYKFSLGFNNPKAFSFDWVNKELFVADRRDDISTVQACKLEHSRCATIHTTHSLITDVVADPVVKTLFWSEVHRVRSAYRKGLIGTMSMDGKQAWFFKGHGKILYPVSLAVDPVRRRVYWADLHKNTIESANYNGNGHIVIVRHMEDAPVSVSFFESRLYWVSEGSNVLSYVSVHSKEIHRMKLPFHNARQVKLHHPLMQPKAESGCNNNPCSHICVEVDPTLRGYACVCPDRHILDVSGHTCIAMEMVKGPINDFHNGTGGGSSKSGVTAASVILCLVLVAVAAIVAVAYRKKIKRLQRGHPSLNVSWLRFRPPTDNLAEDSLTLEDSLSIDYAEELRLRQLQEQQRKGQLGVRRGKSVRELLTPVKDFAKKTVSSASNFASRARSSFHNTISPKSPLLLNNPRSDNHRTVPPSSGIFVDVPVHGYGEVSTDMLSPRESDDGGFRSEL